MKPHERQVSHRKAHYRVSARLLGPGQASPGGSPHCHPAGMLMGSESSLRRAGSTCVCEGSVPGHSEARGPHGRENAPGWPMGSCGQP